MRIFITTRFTSCHRWKDAPDEVRFLRNLHRHCFNVRLEITVTHSDRELEFLQVKQFIDGVIRLRIIPRDDTIDPRLAYSCEQMALIILKEVHERYPGRYISCSVDEDGECGALVGLEDLQ